MTFSKAISAAVLSGAAIVVTALSASAHDYAYRHGATTHVITVSCYRGPWDDVIWDRPNPEFTDSLVAAGYTFPEAHAIAERVCRDPSSVGQPSVLRATMTRILQTSPPNR